MKQKLKTGEEFDVVYAKDMYCYLERAGVSARIKRGMRRRARREAIQRTRVYSEYGACGDTYMYGDDIS